VADTKLPVPGGVLGRLALAVFLWIRQRPFVAPPGVWWALLAVLVIGVILAALGGAPAPVLAALGIGSALAAAPSIAWVRLRRRSDRTLVLLARFGDDESPEYALRAATHLRQLERRLEQNLDLSAALEVRVLKVPISHEHARRLLRYSPARAVVSGTGLEVVGTARWEAWTMVRWHQHVGFVDRTPDGQWIGFIRRRLTRGKASPTAKDDQADVSLLTADKFPAKHADGIEGTLLLIAGADRPSEPSGRRCLDAAFAYREALPLEARAVLEIGRGMDVLGKTGDVVAAARHIEAAGDQDTDHVLLWNACTTLYTEGERQDVADPRERVRVGQKAIATAPEDAIAHANLGFAYGALMQWDDAIRHFERTLRAPWSPDPETIVFDLAFLYVKVRGMDSDSAILEATEPLARRERRHLRRAYKTAKRQGLPGNAALTDSGSAI